MFLSIKVQFLRSFSGRTADETPEWPPSPRRLLLALLGCARPASGEPVPSALAWLAELPPPAIIACDEASERGRRVHSVPHNLRPGEGGVDRELEVQFVRELDGSRRVVFTWEASDPPTGHVADLHGWLRELPYLGQSQDFVAARLELSDRAPAPDPAQTEFLWRPAANGDRALPLAGPDDLALANDAYAQGWNQSALPRVDHRPGVSHWPARLPLYPRAQRYTRQSARPAVETGVFRFTNPASGGRAALTFSPREVCRLAEDLRGCVLRWTQDTPGADLPFFTGHNANGSPHLGFLPLPSIDGPHPDGLVRRLALFLPTPTEPALALLPRLQQRLTAAPVTLAGREVQLVLERRPLLWERRFLEKARVWQSVTPIFLDRFEFPGGDLALYREMTRLKRARGAGALDPTGHERLRRLLDERDRRRDAILRGMLRGAGLPLEAIEEMTPAPVAFACLPPGDQFRLTPARATYFNTSRTHLRLIFREPLAGPVLLGKGRYFGLGLFANIGC